MTIENPQAYLDGVWDWAILNGCFGDTKIKPTDLDGMVERNGHFLVIECKSPGVPVKQGQAMTFNRLVATGMATVMIVWGEQNQPESLQILSPSKTEFIDPCDLDLFRSQVYGWFLYADQQKIGSTAMPLLTRDVLAMFESLQTQLDVHNRLLLQLLDQTKSVKPIRRGSVIDMTGELFNQASA